MTVSVLQVVSNHASFSGGGTGTTLTQAITVTAGSTLIAWGQMSSAGGTNFTSLADDVNGSWGAAIENIDDSGNTERSAVWVFPNSAAGTVTVTMTTSSAPWRGLVLVEVGGAATSSLDGHVGQLQTAPGTGTDGVSSTATTSSNQPALVVGLSFNTDTGSAPTAGSGFGSDGVDTTILGRVESKRVTATGSQTATFTAVNNLHHITFVVVIDETGGGGGGGDTPAPLPTYRTSTADGGSSGTSNRTCAITPAVGDLLVVFCAASVNTNDTPTCSDGNTGGTYTRIGVAAFNASANRFSAFVRDTLVPNTTATTVTVATGSNTSAEIVIVAIKDALRAGIAAIRSSGFQVNQSSGTAPAPVLNQSARTENVTITAIGTLSTSGNNPSPASWSERQDVNQASPTVGLGCSTRDSGFTGTTITYSANAGSNYASVALEIDGSGMTPPEWRHSTRMLPALLNFL